MNKNKRPPIGSVMYDVHENFYRIPDHAGPLKEYVVAAGTVEGYFEGGFVEILLRGKVADEQRSWYVRQSAIGKSVFFTAHEAALHAKALTEKYDRTWAWTKDPPMRRTWECYLKEKK